MGHMESSSPCGTTRAQHIGSCSKRYAATTIDSTWYQENIWLPLTLLTFDCMQKIKNTIAKQVCCDRSMENPNMKNRIRHL
jgi:hypothetical protein